MKPNQKTDTRGFEDKAETATGLRVGAKSQIITIQCGKCCVMEWKSLSEVLWNTNKEAICFDERIRGGFREELISEG